MSSGTMKIKSLKLNNNNGSDYSLSVSDNDNFELKRGATVLLSVTPDDMIESAAENPQDSITLGGPVNFKNQVTLKKESSLLHEQENGNSVDLIAKINEPKFQAEAAVSITRFLNDKLPSKHMYSPSDFNKMKDYIVNGRLPQAGGIKTLPVEHGLNLADVDSKEGNYNFPHHEIKNLFVVGEQVQGFVPIGECDASGAFLWNDNTVRLLVASEESTSVTYYHTLENGTLVDGAHVTAYDMDRDALSTYFDTEDAPNPLVNAEIPYDRIYNHLGREVNYKTNDLIINSANFNGLYNHETATFKANPLRNQKVVRGIERFCSGTISEKLQFETKYGMEDKIMWLSEEYPGGGYGMSWALDVLNRSMYALPSLLCMAGEKLSEINTETDNFIALTRPSYGQQGKIKGVDKFTFPLTDPLKLFLGMKNKSEGAGFLARNGLDNTQCYAFTHEGTQGITSDSSTYFKDPARKVGDTVYGKLVKIKQKWDQNAADTFYNEDGSVNDASRATVKAFIDVESDGYYGPNATSQPDSNGVVHSFWNNSPNPDNKTEHDSVDPIDGKSWIFGHNTPLVIHAIPDLSVLQGLDDFPIEIPCKMRLVYNNNFMNMVDVPSFEGSYIEPHSEGVKNLDGLFWMANDKVYMQEDGANYSIGSRTMRFSMDDYLEIHKTLLAAEDGKTTAEILASSNDVSNMNTSQVDVSYLCNCFSKDNKRAGWDGSGASDGESSGMSDLSPFVRKLGGKYLLKNDKNVGHNSRYFADGSLLSHNVQGHGTTEVISLFKLGANGGVQIMKARDSANEPVKRSIKKIGGSESTFFTDNTIRHAEGLKMYTTFSEGKIGFEDPNIGALDRWSNLLFGSNFADIPNKVEGGDNFLVGTSLTMNVDESVTGWSVDMIQALRCRTMEVYSMMENSGRCFIKLAALDVPEGFKDQVTHKSIFNMDFSVNTTKRIESLKMYVNAFERIATFEDPNVGSLDRWSNELFGSNFTDIPNKVEGGQNSLAASGITAFMNMTLSNNEQGFSQDMQDALRKRTVEIDGIFEFSGRCFIYLNDSDIPEGLTDQVTHKSTFTMDYMLQKN